MKLLNFRAFGRVLAFLSLFYVASAAAAPPPETFGQLRKIHDAAISPDGNRIALVENNGGQYSIRITDLEGKTLQSDLLKLQTIISPNWIQWANDDRILMGISINTLFKKVPAVYTYIFTQNLDEQTGKILVESNGMIRQFNSNVLNFLSDDPTYILMSVESMASSAPEVRKVNVNTGKYVKVQSSDHDIQTWIADREGTVRIGRGISDSTRSNREPDYVMRVKAPGSDEWQSGDAYPGLDHNTSIFGFSENPHELLVGDYAGKDTLGLYVYDLTQKKITRKLFHNDVYDVDGPVYSGDGKKLIGARFLSETSEVVLFDDLESKGQRAEGLDAGLHYRFLGQSKDGSKTLYEVTGSSDSGFIGLYDRATKQLKTLVHQYEGLTPDDLGTVLDVTYKARDDFEIPAYITLPPSLDSLSEAKSIPFIVLPHGGPYARDSDSFDYFAQFFASRGFGVLQMNFRGSEGYGKTFKESGRENWELMLDDVEDGARWLQSEGLSDASKTCIAGWSFGGYAALMGAIRNDGLYKCAISIAGVTDLNDLVHDEEKYTYGRARARQGILAGFDSRKDLKDFSPAKQGNNIKIPVFLAHGKMDQRVHYDQFTRMKKALKKAKVPTSLHVYETDNHFIFIQKNRQDMFKNIAEFLDDSVGESEYMK